MSLVKYYFISHHPSESRINVLFAIYRDAAADAADFAVN